MSTARRHALDVLEFRQVLELVAERATTDAGRARVLALRPATGLERVLDALGLVADVTRLLEARPSWAIERLPDLGSTLSRLPVRGAVLEGAELWTLKGLLRASRLARSVVSAEGEAGRLGRIAARLIDASDVEDVLERSLDETGAVRDGASRELTRIRRNLTGRRARLVSELERYAGGLPERLQVPDGSVTVRGGRYCIPIRREGKGSVGGLVHDESGSRATLFVEPPLAIEPMNEIRELELAEAREIRRVLAELTASLGTRASELNAALDALAELDSAVARARFADRVGGTIPRLFPPGTDRLRIVQGRHPLLAAGGGAVPFDLTLGDDERVLLISGPNAGGKTVALKTIGLLGALAASGVPVPVAPGTQLPLFGAFFAMIGDEQSLAASLSTFGAAVENLVEILDEAGPDAVVLIDEIGSSTDPAEGGALAAVVLARLADQARLTVATTHLGVLKGLAGERDDVVNASLQFDGSELVPTYRLVRDRPGRSFALEIASRHGMPADVIAEARTRLSTDERALETVLSDLEREGARVEKLREEIDCKLETIDAQATDAAARLEEVERRERALERDAGDRAESYLLEARQEVERTIDELEAGFVEASSERERSAVRGQARSRVERAVRERREQRLRARAEGAAGHPPEAASVDVGSHVRVTDGGKVGKVVARRGNRLTLDLEGLRVTVPASEVEPAAAPAPSRPSAGRAATASITDRSALDARVEIDLRGLRVEEVDGRLIPAVDAAIVADLPRLRIIHGKGTGAVRARVRELLEGDARVTSLVAAAPRQGGAGVTIVEFR